MNYFELFGLPESPIIDKGNLARVYFGLQKRFHPDFMVQATDDERAEALEMSAAVNKAFQIFSDADKTLAYFLALKGWLQPDEKYSLPPAFLMDMMELNEHLDEMEPEKVRRQVAMLEEDWYQELLLRVQLKPGVMPGPEAMPLLKEWYYKKKYLHRILDRLAD